MTPYKIFQNIWRHNAIQSSVKYVVKLSAVKRTASGVWSKDAKHSLEAECCCCRGWGRNLLGPDIYLYNCIYYWLPQPHPAPLSNVWKLLYQRRRETPRESLFSKKVFVCRIFFTPLPLSGRAQRSRRATAKAAAARARAAVRAASRCRTSWSRRRFPRRWRGTTRAARTSRPAAPRTRSPSQSSPTSRLSAPETRRLYVAVTRRLSESEVTPRLWITETWKISLSETQRFLGVVLTPRLL